MDKNYPPREISLVISAINGHESNISTKLKTIAVVPYIVNKYKDYPFSLSFLLQCYIRCLKRSGHLTMNNEDPERLAKILLLFFSQFKESKLDDSLIAKFGFTDVLEARFTHEFEDLDLPNKLERALSNAIANNFKDKGDLYIERAVKLIQ